MDQETKNLNILYKFVSKGFPWPLASFSNSRSYCSIENLLFVINEIINNKHIPSGIYNVADDKPLSTNRIIFLMRNALKISQSNWRIPIFIKMLAYIGDIFQYL